ncbi:nitroreductase/quinone reductase family protein [Nocardioides sp.]|uniref:nitroreductase/quinone reductase family protein n=1 Tax=Nocardioides sp. TaxID=35761 RepID=UPI00286B9AD5|nr:nitroreductase/quinone reductase family protein [Nocardioides sp.]
MSTATSGGLATDHLPRLRPWLLLATGAGAVALPVGALLARWTDRPTSSGASWTALLLGSLVAGTLLGVVQGRALRVWLAPRDRVVWVAATAAATLLSSVLLLAPDQPLTAPRGITLAAVAVGLAVGGLLGLVQAVRLSPVFHHARRWPLASAVGWAVSLPIAIYILVAPGSDAGWITQTVVVSAGGALAGATYGVLTGLVLPTLAGSRPVDRLALWLLESRWHDRLPAHLVGLGVIGRESGLLHRLPVLASSTHGRLVVLVDHPGRRTWWRNIETEPDVEVLCGGIWLTARAHVVRPGDPGWLEAYRVHCTARPEVQVPSGTPWVVVDMRLTRRVDP